MDREANSSHSMKGKNRESRHSRSEAFKALSASSFHVDWFRLDEVLKLQGSN